MMLRTDVLRNSIWYREILRTVVCLFAYFFLPFSFEDMNDCEEQLFCSTIVRTLASLYDTAISITFAVKRRVTCAKGTFDCTTASKTVTPSVEIVLSAANSDYDDDNDDDNDTKRDANAECAANSTSA